MQTIRTIRKLRQIITDRMYRVLNKLLTIKA